METHDSPEKAYDLERLIFFSDGVFAIVITLLVIGLHVPPGWDRTLAGLWRAEWRELVAYAVSFVAVGAYWNAHRTLFARVVAFHPLLVVFNLLLLGFVVLLPFAAQLIFETGPAGEPFEILLGLICIVGFAQALLWGCAAFMVRVVDPRLDTRRRLMILAALALAPVVASGGGLLVSQQQRMQGPALWLLTAVLVGLALLRRRLMARPR